MLILYRVLINIIFLISQIIIIYRLIIKKEDFKRFREKFCFFSAKNINWNLIWFHGASVGEIQSIVPLLEMFEKTEKIKKTLVLIKKIINIILNLFLQTPLVLYI